MGLMSQHLELGNIFIDISSSHPKFLEIIMGLFLLGIVDKGPLEVVFKYFPGGPSIEFTRIIFCLIQPVVVPVDPSSSLLSSDSSHEVGTLLIGVSSNGGVSVHDHELFEGGEEVYGLSSVSFEELWRVSFEACSSFVSIVPFVSIAVWIGIVIGVLGGSSATSPGGIGAKGVVPIIIVVLL